MHFEEFRSLEVVFKGLDMVDMVVDGDFVLNFL